MPDCYTKRGYLLPGQVIITAMVALILTAIVGLSLAFLATQNTQLVNLNLNSSVSAMPVYLMALGSLLIGFLISSIFGMIDSIYAFFTIQSKNSKINHTQQTISQLEERVDALEAENAGLKEESEKHHPNILDLLHHNFAVR